MRNGSRNKRHSRKRRELRKHERKRNLVGQIKEDCRDYGKEQENNVQIDGERINGNRQEKFMQ